MSGPKTRRRLAWLILGLAAFVGVMLAGAWLVRLLLSYFHQSLDRQSGQGSVVSMFTGAGALLVSIAALLVAYLQLRQGNSAAPVEQSAPHEQRERDARDRLRQHLGRQDRLRRMGDLATHALLLRVHPAIDLPQPAVSSVLTVAMAESQPRAPHHVPPRPDETQSLDRELPTFVGRDKSPAILDWMRRARDRGGFLVLVGDSSVGKTRLLYEAAREVSGDFAVLAPDLGDGDLVNKIAEAIFPLPRLIVWLDELQRFLDGPYLTPGSTPITAATVRRLLDAPTPVIIVGTLWPTYVARLRATEADPATEHPQPRYPNAVDILDHRRLHTVSIDTFSKNERAAAGQLAAQDPRLAKALADPDYNVTQVLAGAPELIRRYKQATEEQKAVLHAAVDARRLGKFAMQAPLPEQFLRESAPYYLSNVHPGDTWFPPALAELTSCNRPQDRATAPLIPVPNAGRTKELGYIVADYLQQYLTRRMGAVRPNAVTKLLETPAPASHPAPARAVTAHHHAGLTETLLRWTESAIVIDPGVTIWDATAAQRASMGSRIIRFAPTGTVEQNLSYNPFNLSYNPLKEIRRRTSEELGDSSEMTRLLTNDPSEKGEAVALLLLAVLARYLEDEAEPSLRGLSNFVEEPSFYSGMQLISYLSNVQDLTRPGHLFSAVLADEFQKLEDEDFEEEMFLRVRGVLSPFTTLPLGDRTWHHDLPLAELVGSEKPTTLYVTFPEQDAERLAPFLRLLGAQFARGLCDAATRRPTLIAFAGADALGPNPLLNAATSPIEGVKLATNT